MIGMIILMRLYLHTGKCIINTGIYIFYIILTLHKFRTSRHDSSKYTPLLMYKCEARLPVDLTFLPNECDEENDGVSTKVNRTFFIFPNQFNYAWNC